MESKSYFPFTEALGMILGRALSDHLESLSGSGATLLNTNFHEYNTLYRRSRTDVTTSP